jgi:8-oxo-dGTP pyrophosphatase MutT (NUDIX family)
VFLVRRHDKVAFMGGAYVFPGGRVDEADRSLDTAKPHRVAAVRELFEEAGILLARRQNGEPIAFRSADESARFSEYRRALAGGSITMHQLIEREGLVLDLDALVLFAHWLTPEIEIKRFDTQFFIAVVPAGQNAVHDDSETTHGEWMDPDDAVDRCRRDEIALPPPTWTTLRRLSRFASVEDVLNWARTRRVVRVQPAFVQDEEGTMLTLPGDPTFPALDGFETPEETRFVLVNGRWRAISS